MFHNSTLLQEVYTNKLRLIWNLVLCGKTNIEHVLQAHYRVITDINWHTTECDMVVSASIDSWVWAWHLRNPRKPIFGAFDFKTFAYLLTHVSSGLSAFKCKPQTILSVQQSKCLAGGMQVQTRWQHLSILAC